MRKIISFDKHDRWQLIWLIFIVIFALGQGCSKSKDNGGTTGGNPISSLPLVVSIDVK